MHKTGHYGAALLLYAPVGFALASIDPTTVVHTGLAVVCLARLPDYDRNVPFLTHRGVTHTLLFLVVVFGSTAVAGYLVAERVGSNPVQFAAVGTIAPTVGVGSHLLADLLTPLGVPLLWPVTDERFSLDVVTASNPVANLGLFVVGVVATVATVVLTGLL